MVRVYDLAHSRAGDKGNTSNISVIAYDEAGWAILREQLTPERVMQAFAHIAKGPVPPLRAAEAAARSTSSSRARSAAASRARSRRTRTASRSAA